MAARTPISPTRMGCMTTNTILQRTISILITKYAMSLPHFTDICDQTRYTYTPVGGPEAGQERTLVTTNRLIDPNLDPDLYYRYARGIKTGSHDQAGYCLVSTATRGGYSYMCVALGSPSVDENGNKISTRGEMIDSKKFIRMGV